MCSPLQDLLAQLLRAPAERRIGHIERVERLHDTLEPGRTYPLDFIAYQITQYRQTSDEPTLLVGDAVLPDLRLMIDALSRVTPVEDDAGEAVLRPKELAARWSVSLKTLDRYRGLGLRWRWRPAERPTARHPIELVYTMSAVRYFEGRHAKRLGRAASSGGWSGDEIEGALVRARRLMQRSDATANRVARFVAGKHHRPAETLRRRLLAEASGTGRLSERDAAVIERAHRMGVPMAKITERFGRSRASVYRILQGRRARALKSVAITFASGATPLPEQDVSFKDVASQAASPAVTTAVRQLPESLRGVFGHASLTHAAETSLLSRMHRLRATAGELRDRLDPSKPRAGDMDRMERCLAEADELRRRVARHQGGLLAVVVRQHLIDRDELNERTLLERLSVALDELGAALTEYDPWQATSFERTLRLRLQRRLSAIAPPAAGSRARKRSDTRVLTESLIQRCEALGLKAD
ncbi:hypothetical protein Pan265_20150 [Mucisphaera calidilacus]|uniref:Uncharacterized protein n=1 Tax=Mucisphaera calidilacus TaxID=2527982 RepID=A0A518BYV0_9BACT|nr:hypothetical protein Pan265_20150 [Mucisphaera calidilacus]